MRKCETIRLPVSILLISIGLVFGNPAFVLGQRVFDDAVSRTRMPTGRLIFPVGKTLESYGRPVDLELSTDGQWLFAKSHQSVWVVDCDSFELVQQVEIAGGASLYGLAVNDKYVYVSNAKNSLFGLKRTNNKAKPFALDKEATVEFAADSFPCGIVLSSDGKLAYVCLSKKNSVAVVDLEIKKVIKHYEVGIGPFDALLSRNQKHLLVSSIGGRRALEADKTAPSAGTETVVDKRGVASSGTVSVISLVKEEVVREIEVGLQPSVLMLSDTDTQAMVCNSNSDSVCEFDFVSGETESVNVKPNEKLPFGSMPSCLCRSREGKFTFIALAGNNAIQVRDGNGELLGYIPTGWYPTSLSCSENYLFIGNVKGVGGRAKRRDIDKGGNSHDHLGSLQKVALADVLNREKLAEWSATARKNSLLPQALRSMVAPAVRTGKAPVPVPEKLGDPSVFKHVIYVIKENRTFDQVYGDVKESRSKAELCVFPEEITPNHHALAKRFGLLDNYYCNGVLSADGHSWATEGNVTPYLERAFGGFARSYTFGDDPITYSSSGFIWDQFLDGGLSFRNYGEMDYAKPPEGMKYVDIYQAFKAGKKIEFTQNIGVDRLRKYSCRDYPGWNMMVPDVLRMERFLNEFREFEKNDGLPSLCLVYLPQDHLGGGVTSRSHMADNDLALGRLVDAVSHSKYWKDTVIIVNEDDPQNGYDHIDGHRSLCLVISPYSKPGINHSFYNQTSVLRTILHLFGLAPLNQQVASMPLMSDCFQLPANLNAYNVIEANFPLDELPPKQDEQSSVEQRWRSILSTVPIQRTGMKTEQDEDNLNRFVWHEMKGWETSYPIEWSGPHARGLKELGLKLDPNAEE